MKKLFIFCLLTLGLLIYASCSKTVSKAECHIQGVVPDQTKEGKKIFLVPFEGVQDAAHVDSVVIKDGKFNFDKDSTGMFIIRLDYHYRYGTQDLLVVTEPGTVKVTIGPNSTSAGTPQNDSLQVWKNQTIKHNIEYSKLRMLNDKQPVDSITNKLKKLQDEYKAFNKAFYNRQPNGVFKNFLHTMI